MAPQLHERVKALECLLLSLELLGFDVSALNLPSSMQVEDEGDADDFRVVGTIAEGVELCIDYCHADGLFALTTALNPAADAEAILIEALKISSALAVPRRIIMNPCTSKIEIKSELSVDHLAVDELAFELYYLSEVALTLLIPRNSPIDQLDGSASHLVRG